MINLYEKVIFVLSISFLLFLKSSNSLANNELALKRFYYQIKIPQTNQSCSQEASKLAQRFSDVTGLNVIENGCRGEVEFADTESAYKMYSVGLTYLSIKEIFPYSALVGMDVMGIPHSAVGMFSTYSECLGALQKQSEFYEEKTGYQIIASTCLEGTYETYKKSYVLRIDGVAKNNLSEPNSKLYALPLKFQGQLNSNLRVQLESFLVSKGASIVWENENVIFYYKKYPLLISQEVLGEFTDADECESQIDEARKIFLNLGNNDAVVGCLPGKYFNSKKVYLEVVRESSGGSNYFIDIHQYSSQAECLNDKPRLIDEAASRGHKPLGVLFRKEKEGKFLLHLFRSLY
ncbi:MAG: hypothetical protein IPM57_08715 [Oligoflexia bacterium]|nr:hypothetical protein [Oligoflexia bacterium]